MSLARDNGAGVTLSFDDNRLLPVLFGVHNENLARLEQRLDVRVDSRGNSLGLSGAVDQVEIASAVLRALYEEARAGRDIGLADVDAAIRMADSVAAGGVAPSGEARDPADSVSELLSAQETTISTRKRVIRPRSPRQSAYIRALATTDLVFGVGPSGTGKTYLAVAVGVQALMAGAVDRLILSRPAVEAGERLGFLPGDMREKVDPYLRPLYDALYDMLPAETVTRKIESGEIEIAPLAFMRGRTLAHAFVILDEAQNATPVQMRMFLTRLGNGARMVIAGDQSQVDLPNPRDSGLDDALAILEGVDGVASVRFLSEDVVRHPLVARVVEAYERADAARLGESKARRRAGGHESDT